MVTFDVVGNPMPKGSLKGYVPNWQRSQIARVRPTVVLTSTTKGLPEWTNTVRATARIANIPLLQDCPVTVGLVFRLPAPDLLRKKPTRPAHITRPDLDKLVRAVLDAITGVGWYDDKQVDSIKATKRYALPHEDPGVKVFITPSPREGAV